MYAYFSFDSHIDKPIFRWSRVVQTVCNPGEIFLAEEWTYSSALASSGPINVRAAPVAVDGEGMRSDDLRKVLAEWDEPARGAKRWVSITFFGFYN